MCYFLYGCINSGINIEDYKKISFDRPFFFHEGDETDIKSCIAECTNKYRITHEYCDCGTALGAYDTNKKDLLELADYISQMRKVRGIKHIFISKNWAQHKTEKEKTVHIDNIDIVHYLANIEDDCLYKIQLFKKYY